MCFAFHDLNGAASAKYAAARYSAIPPLNQGSRTRERKSIIRAAGLLAEFVVDEGAVAHKWPVARSEDTTINPSSKDHLRG